MPRAKPTTDNPLSDRLRAAVQDLLRRIDETEREIAAAILQSGKKLARTPNDNTFVTESAVRPVVSLKAKLEVLQAALGELDKKVADAPDKMAAYEASLAPLSQAIAARDLLQVDVEATLTLLCAQLFSLRAANEEAHRLLKVAVKGWQAVGGVLATDIPRPSFPPVRFDNCKAVRQLQHDTPFGEITMSGDTSGRAGRVIQNAAEPADD
jgi:hypothetical protein